MGIKVCGTGAVVGGRSVTNKEFVEICRKNDERTDSARKFAQKAKDENKETNSNWILTRTGIKQRVWIDNWHKRKDGLEGPGITLDQWEQDPSSGINTSDLAA
jgi:3-oxoacyl-[acyl-carrier-protein] synthase III